MWSWRKYSNWRGDGRDAATERLLRSHKADLSDEDLRSSIAGAWRRIEQRRGAGRPRRQPHAGVALHRLLIPSLALLCFLVGLWIGLSLELDDHYGMMLSSLASHPLIAELAP